MHCKGSCWNLDEKGAIVISNMTIFWYIQSRGQTYGTFVYFRTCSYCNLFLDVKLSKKIEKLFTTNCSSQLIIPIKYTQSHRKCVGIFCHLIVLCLLTITMLPSSSTTNFLWTQLVQPYTYLCTEKRFELQHQW